MADPECNFFANNRSLKLRLILLTGIAGPFVAFSIALIVHSFHVIDEGHVGIYFRHGALLVLLV